MQKELSDNGYDIFILGINQVGFDSANAQFTEGRDIPWLQDQESIQLWEAWNVQYRDVYIFDETLTLRDVFNLTQYDLNATENYASLLTLLSTL